MWLILSLLLFFQSLNKHSFLLGLVAKSGPSPPLRTDSRYRSTLAADATKLHQLKRRK